MASSYSGVRLSTPNETHELVLIPRTKNSEYEYKESDFVYFRGRPAQPKEQNLYRLQKGVNTSTDSVYVFSSSMPEDLKIGDRVKFLGRLWTVESTGYYFDQNRIVNSSVFDEEYIIAKCPKGFTLQ